MMGNENSQLSGLEVEKKAIEVLDGWTLHSATVSCGNVPTLCVFIGDLLQTRSNTPSLEVAAKNLMLHRHPYILKYVSSWKKNGKLYLATEEVMPLSHVLAKLTPLQICIGLHGILKALIFLHEKALASHNNVCCAAIYVTTDGTWKLGGLEYLCRFSKLTHSYLQQTKGTRYEKAIAPEEDTGKAEPVAIDTFAYGVFAEEVLRGQTDDCVPALSDFREVCRIQLQNRESKLRPSLTSLLSHSFFMHNFITIHSFLLELPLKTEPDKQTFFRSLSEELSNFPEELVASQLGGTLLSRLVLLDQTAQDCLLPILLTPKEVEITNTPPALIRVGECLLPVRLDGTIYISENVSSGLFTNATYRQHIVPKLLQMMCVRDAQVRLLLLSHFPALCRAFTREQLKAHVLPELLVGIKDTNDHLVSVTLRALADLVPLLGAATVIGGKRGKLFTDGRPKARGTTPAMTHKSPTRVPAASESQTFPDSLPERPSPDGGEDHVPTTDEETEAWSDWDGPLESHAPRLEEASPPSESGSGHTSLPGHGLPDITTLDIKHSSSTSIRIRDEFDFFQDMEPVISKTQFTHVDVSEEVSLGKATGGSRFDVTTEVEAVGWEDDLDDWGEVADVTRANATASTS